MGVGRFSSGWSRSVQLNIPANILYWEELRFGFWDECLGLGKL